MTTEISVMNKYAVALATDSAVSLGNGKIYNSANKLFALSKYQPVGIMIYNSAELNGIPWETIIKIYRTKLGEKSFSTLKEYSDDFFDFLKNDTEIFIETTESLIVTNIASELLNKLLRDFQSTLSVEILNDIEKLIAQFTEFIDNVVSSFENNIIIDEANSIATWACLYSNNYRQIRAFNP